MAQGQPLCSSRARENAKLEPEKRQNWQSKNAFSIANQKFFRPGRIIGFLTWIWVSDLRSSAIRVLKAFFFFLFGKSIGGQSASPSLTNGRWLGDPTPSSIARDEMVQSIEIIAWCIGFEAIFWQLVACALGNRADRVAWCIANSCSNKSCAEIRYGTWVSRCISG